MQRLNPPEAATLSSARLRAAACFVLLSGAYVGTAKLGIELPVSHGVITPVWAPSGISLAALLILGLRYWPAIAVGAFIANATSDAPLAVAAGISVGNTLEAVLGAVLARRLGVRVGLDRVRAVLALVVGAAVVSTAVGATNGVSILKLADETDQQFGSAWLLWWFGDAVGDLMVAPLLLVLYALRSARPSVPQLLEGLALLVAVAGAAVGVFLAGGWRYPYLIFPLLLWGTLRFRQLGAATTSFVVGAIGTWGAVEGMIPIAGDTQTQRVQILQALFVVITVSLLLVGATLAEREAGRSELLETALGLSEAQELAHIGSWRWDIKGDVVTWSDELFRIFGLAPQSESVSYASYLDRIHPADRTFVDESVHRAYTDRRAFVFEHRIVQPDGTVRVISSRGRVITEGDEAVAMLGTAQDVTEQRQAQRLREDILSAVSHELRTPLTAVLGFAITLEQRWKELPGETIEMMVGELSRGARRLDRLLVDLLDVERVRRGALGLNRQRIDVFALIERTVAACPLDGRHVGIGGGPILADVDPAKLERMVENLVLNAVKHTPHESSISVRLDAEGADLLLTVEDEGPGVPDEYKEAVFETFNRGPSLLSATPGAGIGLALVARLAEVHGGRAWVEDAPGGGAAFRVVLPDSVFADEASSEPPAARGRPAG